MPLVAALTRDARCERAPAADLSGTVRMGDTAAGRMVGDDRSGEARLESRALADFAPAETVLAGLPVETVVRYGDRWRRSRSRPEVFGADLSR